MGRSQMRALLALTACLVSSSLVMGGSTYLAYPPTHPRLKLAAPEDTGLCDAGVREVDRSLSLRGGDRNVAGTFIDEEADKFMAKAGIAASSAFFKLADPDGTGKVTLRSATEAAKQIMSRKAKQLAAGSFVPTKFSYKHKGIQGPVHVVGSWSGWLEENELKIDQSGDWVDTIELPPGKHQFKFLINTGEWVVNPEMTIVDDGEGTAGNNMIEVPAIEKSAEERAAELKAMEEEQKKLLEAEEASKRASEEAKRALSNKAEQEAAAAAKAAAEKTEEEAKKNAEEKEAAKKRKAEEEEAAKKKKAKEEEAAKIAAQKQKEEEERKAAEAADSANKAEEERIAAEAAAAKKEEEEKRRKEEEEKRKEEEDRLEKQRKEDAEKRFREAEAADKRRQEEAEEFERRKLEAEAAAERLRELRAQQEAEMRRAAEEQAAAIMARRISADEQNEDAEITKAMGGTEEASKANQLQRVLEEARRQNGRQAGAPSSLRTSIESIRARFENLKMRMPSLLRSSTEGAEGGASSSLSSKSAKWSRTAWEGVSTGLVPLKQKSVDVAASVMPALRRGYESLKGAYSTTLTYAQKKVVIRALLVLGSALILALVAFPLLGAKLRSGKQPPNTSAVPSSMLDNLVADVVEAVSSTVGSFQDGGSGAGSPVGGNGGAQTAGGGDVEDLNPLSALWSIATQMG